MALVLAQPLLQSGAFLLCVRLRAHRVHLVILCHIDFHLTAPLDNYFDTKPFVFLHCLSGDGFGIFENALSKSTYSRPQLSENYFCQFFMFLIKGIPNFWLRAYAAERNHLDRRN